MMRGMVSYVITLLGLVVIDGIWLKLVMLPLYQKYLAHHLAATVTVWPIVVFYLVYPAGLCFFVVNPSLQKNLSLLWTLGSGFLLGIIAYSAYDLTNLATLHRWPIAVALLDIIWGAILSASAAALSVWLTKMIVK